MTLSILICSLESRSDLLSRLVKHLEDQINDWYAAGLVEILVEVDNREMSTGKKRQKLLNRAKGKYIVFIDDDDWVSNDYVILMLEAAKTDSDCFAIRGTITTDGVHEIEWRISMDYANCTIIENRKRVYLRTTNHITAVKRLIALKGSFPDKSNAEDKAYSESILPHLKTECVIEPLMYHYRYSTLNKQYT